MERLRENISPALILSVVAVFISLGGGAYAALSANSVGTKQLKKDAVTAKKIKKNAVTSAKIAANAVVTAKIKNDAVNGDKVLESSLGQVPSAATAGSATTAATAGSAASADSAKTIDGYKRLGLVKLRSSASNPSMAAAQAAATEVPLFRNGPITIYAKCFKVGTSLYASHYIKTSVNGVVFDSTYDSAYGSPNYLNTGTAESDREIFYTSVGPDSYTYYNTADPTFVFTPDGQSYKYQTELYAKQGTLGGGNGAWGSGDVCVITGEGGRA